MIFLNENFLFFRNEKKSATTIKDISTTTVPKKCRRPNYPILQYTEGNPSTTREAYYLETAVDHFKPMYIKAIDAIINSIKDKFGQTGFKVFGQVKQLLLKSIRKDSAVDEIETLQFQRGL